MERWACAYGVQRADSAGVVYSEYFKAGLARYTMPFTLSFALIMSVARSSSKSDETHLHLYRQTSQVMST